VPLVTPPRRRKASAPASDAPTRDGADAGVFPHQLRAGDVIVDEHGIAWELLGRPSKSVGTQDFVVRTRRIDRAADMREERWRAHERVKVRRA
jgi:hypothetical protein